jgi:hypothetical protein
MKTYRSNISTGFKKVGIRPILETRNSELFVSCINGRVMKEGLEGYLPEITSLIEDAYPMVDDVTGSTITFEKRWPFPQLFITSVGVFIGGLEGLFYWNNDSPMTLHNFGTGSVVWPWTCADINQVPMFSSGNALVYFNDLTNAYVVVN